MRSSRKAASGLPDHSLDDQAEHVDREAVVPHRARLVASGALASASRNSGAGVGQGRGRRRGRPELVHRRVAAVAVGEARRVAQQVLHRGLALRLARSPRSFCRGVSLDDADLHVGELRQVLADRIGQQQLALVVQHHDRDRNHRLGHRRDREDASAGHRRLAAGSASRRSRSRRAGLCARWRHGAGHLACVDLGLQSGVRRCRRSADSPTFSGAMTGSWSASAD